MIAPSGLPTLLRWQLPALLALALAGSAALFTGVLAAQTPRYAVLVAGLPVVVGLLTQTRLALALCLFAMPFPLALPGLSGVEVGPSDVLLGLLLVASVAQLLGSPSARARARALRPLLPAFGIYFATCCLSFAGAPSTGGVIKLVQRFELTILPCLIALLADERLRRVALRAYVLGSAVLSVAFAVHGLGTSSANVLGVQKNPAGQFMANAMIMLIALELFRGRWRLLIVPLAAGLVASQSRGALVGAAASALVLVLIRAGAARWKLALAAAGVLVVMAVGYSLLPAAAQQRLFTTSSTSDYALQTRVAYRKDAEALIAAHPVLGVGLGNYHTGSFSDLTYNTDPHNVVLRELGEGGVVLLAGLVVLLGTTSFVLLRRRALNEYASVALAVQVGVFVHGLADTYWVRSTPDLGWFLTGAALAAAPAVSARLGHGERVA